MKNIVSNGGAIPPKHQVVEDTEIDLAASRLLALAEMFELTSATIKDAYGNVVSIRRDKHGFYNSKITRETYITVKE